MGSTGRPSTAGSGSARFRFASLVDDRVARAIMGSRSKTLSNSASLPPTTMRPLFRAALRSRPANGHASYLPAIRKLVFEYCDKWPSSAATRKYIDAHITSLAAANPHVEVVVKQRNQKEPVVRGFYVNNRDKVIPLKSLEVTAIQQKVQLLLDSSGAKIVPLKRRTVESTTESPRGIWSARPSSFLLYPTMSLDLDISTEELTWLQASAFLDRPPSPKDDDVFMQDVSILSVGSSSYSTPSSPKRAASLSTPPRSGSSSPRSEWLYRQPKSSPSIRHRSAHPLPYPRPLTGYTKQGPPSLARSASTASTRSICSTSPTLRALDHDARQHSSSSSNYFWSSMLRPRPRSERTIPLLRTIPSESQIALTPADISAPIPKNIISSPRNISARPPSVSSTLSSVSISRSDSPSPSSSSRSESPVTPISLSLSSSPYSTGGAVRPRHRQLSPYQHRRHRIHIHHPNHDSEASLPPLSQSCPPSKSILTRTSSVSTRSSSHTASKSVKFAANPTVHYASRGYWDLDVLDSPDHENLDMGINVDSMDVDDPLSFAGYRGDHQLDDLRDLASLRELQCPTPTPEREKEKARGIKRLMSLSRKPAKPTTATNTNAVTAHKPPQRSRSSHRSRSPRRPVISTPYPLGTVPSHPSAPSLLPQQAHEIQSSAALRRAAAQPSAKKREASEPVSLPDLFHRSTGTLKSAPSCESFRSSRSLAARSTRSLGSVKSTSSTRGLRAWFGRTIGWTDS
ncbi:hypothetical protein CVT26_002695 [Gymnopilus dilepis]|uniref:Large ribosomal subunit protein mL43 n=1 Tax=Gymnopilus dilepis TaxID=231916 RepID=A0A409VCD6_9AGAR|nr:hypothetical protein CVT26_002695 [Gymnopilus dilepis]